MIVSVKNKKSEAIGLLDIVRECNSENFYITYDNKRLFVSNQKTLRKLLKSSHHGYYEDFESRRGIIVVWKSYGGEKARNYVKVLSSTSRVAKDLLTVLLWNYDKQLFVKLKKDSNLISVFREKGFRFAGGRGSEVLLTRTPFSRE